MRDIVIEDTIDGKRLMAELESICRKKIHVGYQAGEADHDGVDMVDIVAFNEFGTSNIPSRPFLRTTAEKHEDKIEAFAKKQIRRLINGEADANSVCIADGVYVKGLIQKTIVEEKWIPNAPYTIAKKGSDHPLIDTGLMRQSVNFVIEDGEEN